MTSLVLYPITYNSLLHNPSYWYAKTKISPIQNQVLCSSNMQTRKKLYRVKDQDNSLMLKK